jgi:signal transduction histidine kinase
MLVELMNRARSQVRITLEEARQALWDLRHDSAGGALLDSLQAFTEQLSEQSGIPILVEIAGDPIPLKPEADRNLLAATREAVRNAVTHGKPKQVRVVISYAPEQVRIEVIDDGVGFEAGSPRIAAGHYGLQGMRERMENVGGSLRLLSHHTQGTRVIAELPLSGGRA